MIRRLATRLLSRPSPILLLPCSRRRRLLLKHLLRWLLLLWLLPVPLLWRRCRGSLLLLSLLLGLVWLVWLLLSSRHRLLRGPLPRAFLAPTRCNIQPLFNRLENRLNLRAHLLLDLVQFKPVLMIDRQTQTTTSAYTGGRSSSSWENQS